MIKQELHDEHSQVRRGGQAIKAAGRGRGGQHPSPFFIRSAVLWPCQVSLHTLGANLPATVA